MDSKQKLWGEAAQRRAWAAAKAASQALNTRWFQCDRGMDRGIHMWRMGSDGFRTQETTEFDASAPERWCGSNKGHD